MKNKLIANIPESVEDWKSMMEYEMRLVPDLKKYVEKGLITE